MGDGRDFILMRECREDESGGELTVMRPHLRSDRGQTAPVCGQQISVR